MPPCVKLDVSSPRGSGRRSLSDFRGPLRVDSKARFLQPRRWPEPAARAYNATINITAPRLHYPPKFWPQPCENGTRRGSTITTAAVMKADDSRAKEQQPGVSRVSAGAMVAEATTCEQLLEVAGVLVLPGEETVFWQKQEVHHQRRQAAASHALRRLAKMLCGASLQGRRAQVVATEEFERLCRCAATPSPEPLQGDTPSAMAALSDALRALGSLAPLPTGACESAAVLQQRVAAGSSLLPPAHLSGCLWSCSRIGLEVDPGLDEACKALALPFRIVSGLTSGVVNIDSIIDEVPFQAELLVTRDGKKVKERRETCWMADPGVGGLAYSGKIMAPIPFTPLIRKVRDTLHEKTGQFFDCALLNLYPFEDTACKWHADPDMGRLWARDSIVVSIGETRRFNFRELSEDGSANEDEPHSCRVFDGDCIWMFDDCNDNYHHCVMKAEGEGNQGPRASIVFKRALADAKGNKGHGAWHHSSGTSTPQRSGPGRSGGRRSGGRGGRGRGRDGQGGRGRGRKPGRAGHKQVGRPRSL